MHLLRSSLRCRFPLGVEVHAGIHTHTNKGQGTYMRCACPLLRAVPIYSWGLSSGGPQRHHIMIPDWGLSSFLSLLIFLVAFFFLFSFPWVFIATVVAYLSTEKNQTSRARGSAGKPPSHNTPPFAHERRSNTFSQDTHRIDMPRSGQSEGVSRMASRWSLVVLGKVWEVTGKYDTLV